MGKASTSTLSAAGKLLLRLLRSKDKKKKHACRVAEPSAPAAESATSSGLLETPEPVELDLGSIESLPYVSADAYYPVDSPLTEVKKQRTVVRHDNANRMEREHAFIKCGMPKYDEYDVTLLDGQVGLYQFVDRRDRLFAQQCDRFIRYMDIEKIPNVLAIKYYRIRDRVHDAEIVFETPINGTRGIFKIKSALGASTKIIDQCMAEIFSLLHKECGSEDDFRKLIALRYRLPVFILQLREVLFSNDFDFVSGVLIPRARWLRGTALCDLSDEELTAPDVYDREPDERILTVDVCDLAEWIRFKPLTDRWIVMLPAGSTKYDVLTAEDICKQRNVIIKVKENISRVVKHLQPEVKILTESSYIVKAQFEKADMTSKGTYKMKDHVTLSSLAKRHVDDYMAISQCEPGKAIFPRRKKTCNCVKANDAELHVNSPKQARDYRPKENNVCLYADDHATIYTIFTLYPDHNFYVQITSDESFDAVLSYRHTDDVTRRLQHAAANYDCSDLRFCSVCTNRDMGLSLYSLKHVPRNLIEKRLSDYWLKTCLDGRATFSEITDLNCINSLKTWKVKECVRFSAIQQIFPDNNTWG